MVAAKKKSECRKAIMTLTQNALRLRTARTTPHLRPTATWRRLASSVSPATLTIAGREVQVPTGLFIDNEFRASAGGTTFDVESPTTGKPILSIQEGRAEDVDVAVKAARAAFAGREWGGSNPVRRGDLMLKLAALMERDKEDIIALEMLDTGKTRRQAEGLDFPASVGTLKYYAGWADKIQGLTSFNIPKTFAYTRREAVGVCGQIIPWK